MEKEAEKAQKLMREGKLQEAVAGLQQKSRTPASQKERLFWNLTLSQLLLKSNKPRLARPYLDQILGEVDFYHLEAWDPALALKCLKLVWTGFNALQEPAMKDAAREVLYRIAKLDLGEGIRLGLG